MSNESVIDNENVVLLDQLKRILPNTTRASIAVGYFFISGFSAIMDSFDKIESSGNPDHVVRILISPTTNRLTAEALLAQNESFEDAQRKAATSSTDGRAVARKQVRSSLGHMRQTPDERKAIAGLQRMIQKRKLQVRVYTRERLHAKAYIFELDNPQLPRMSIVGSSNLSISGIREHTELNLRTNVDNDSEKLLEWFDRHWEESEEFTEEVADILDDSWAKARTPLDIYRKAVLHEHGTLDDIDVDDAGSKIELFEFQKMATASAIQKINDYGGVVVADVVGTGKSYIGSMILKYLKEKNRSKPLIICPPHLIDMWKDYVDKFDVHAEVISRYKIGMDDNILKRYTNCDTILVDESHNFRNRNRAYEALYSFMEQQSDDSCIIMLTATPISNGVTDLKNQLKLFPADRIANVQPLGNATLDEYFKGAEHDHKLTPDGEERIRDLLRHILIRRTRKQIQDNYAKRDGDRYYLESESGRKYFPKRRLDNPEEYDIDEVYQNSFERIQDYVEQLKLARYSPGRYIKTEYRNTTHPEYKKYHDLDSSMLPLMGIVRTVLLKRMESSIAAFASSVTNFAKGSEKFLDYIKDGVVPIGKDYQDRIYKSVMSDDERYSEDVPGPSAYDIAAFDIDAWKQDIVSDIAVFSSILNLLPRKERYHKYDDKLKTLHGMLTTRKNQKTLLFTESRVTAEYVYGYLRENMPNVRIGQTDSGKSSREKSDMIKRFDPVNNAVEIAPEEQIDILVSTDVLSEGVNLQAGRTVINYDFHWNPVRLIQRVGRIDRIGSEHDVVDVINFLPTTKVDSALRLKERVSNKIDTIRRIIGHDQKILESSEAIDKDAVQDIYSGDEAVLDKDADGILDIIQTRAEIDADRIRGDDRLRRRVDDLPLGIRCAAGSGRLLVACEADERILLGDEVIMTKTFRRHYEATAAGSVRKIGASSFLKTMGDNAGKGMQEESVDPAYDELLGTTYKRFTRDMKNEQARKQETKLQRYFERKLARVSDHKDLGRRSKRLIPSITAMMVANRQPYRNLNDLRKRINSENMGDREILDRLESILKRPYSYRREIGRPRILYSMRVN